MLAWKDLDALGANRSDLSYLMGANLIEGGFRTERGKDHFDDLDYLDVWLTPLGVERALLVHPSDTGIPDRRRSPNDLISQERAAEILKCSERTIQRRIEDNTIRGYGAKGKRKVSQAELDSKAAQILKRRPRKKKKKKLTKS